MLASSENLSAISQLAAMREFTTISAGTIFVARSGSTGTVFTRPNPPAAIYPVAP